MRLVVVVAVVCLAGCASDKLAQAPPAGVDFSGRWKLNEADSDDPQRLILGQSSTLGTRQGTSGGPDGGTGGRGGRQRGERGGAGNPGSLGGSGGPMMPPVSALSEGLRWPGKQLEIKQVAGVVAFTSDGINRVCQPVDARKTHRHHSADRDEGSTGRGTRAQGREALPPQCGWAEKTLIVQGGDPDDERPPFEEHYSLSDDGQRLVEVVGFTRGRSSGFTMSRVWDRSVQ
jgi:hypothetical protein